MSRRQALFDRFADGTERNVSRAWFFMFCVVLVVVWAPTIAFLEVDTWQLIINTLTTIITFLLVALLTNTTRRRETETEERLKAIEEKVDLVLRLARRGA